MLVLLPQVVRTFREKGIPCDVVWMDIDYMDGFRCFTFDSVSILLWLLHSTSITALCSSYFKIIIPRNLN
jgi:hypothetical protein